MILGALTSGALVESTSMTVLLTLPAIAVTLCFVVIWFGVADDAAGGTPAARPAAASAWSPLAIGLVMGGLILVRLQGPGSLVPWLVLVLGLLAFVAVRALRAARTRSR